MATVYSMLRARLASDTTPLASLNMLSRQTGSVGLQSLSRFSFVGAVFDKVDKHSLHVVSQHCSVLVIAEVGDKRTCSLVPNDQRQRRDNFFVLYFCRQIQTFQGNRWSVITPQDLHETTCLFYFITGNNGNFLRDGL